MMEREIVKLPDLKLADLFQTRQVYHGTAIEHGECNFHLVENIDCGNSRKNLDFGPGYYVTTEFNQAKNWAETLKKHKMAGTNDSPMARVLSENLSRISRNDVSKEIDSLVIEYPFIASSETELMNYKFFSRPCPKWFGFIFANRQQIKDSGFYPDDNLDCKYDFVYGYMADGKFAKVIKAMFKKMLEDLSEEEYSLLYGTFLSRKSKTGTQISFHNKDTIRNCLEDGIRRIV